MRRLLHEKSAATFSTVDLLRNTFHRGTVEDRYAGVSSADVIIKFVSARLIGLSGRICFLPVFFFFFTDVQQALHQNPPSSCLKTSELFNNTLTSPADTEAKEIRDREREKRNNFISPQSIRTLDLLVRSLLQQNTASHT